MFLLVSANTRFISDNNLSAACMSRAAGRVFNPRLFSFTISTSSSALFFADGRSGFSLMLYKCISGAGDAFTMRRSHSPHPVFCPPAVSVAVCVCLYGSWQMARLISLSSRLISLALSLSISLSLCGSSHGSPQNPLTL